MILYERDSFWSQVFVYRGGVIIQLWQPWLYYFLYCCAAFSFSSYFNLELIIHDESRSISYFGGFVSFLLIFRLNQCYARYEAGKTSTGLFFSSLSAIVSIANAYMRGAGFYDPEVVSQLSQEEMEKAERLRICAAVHIIRYCVAIGVSLKYHCRITEHILTCGELQEENLPMVLFDYSRIKGLMYPEEHEILDAACGLYVEEQDETAKKKNKGHWKYHVNFRYHEIRRPESGTDQDAGDGPILLKQLLHTRSNNYEPQQQGTANLGCALPVLLTHMLRHNIMRPCGAKWGYPERVLNVLESHLQQALHTFEMLDRLITMPLVLGYLQHCKLLFLTFMLVYPLTIDSDVGFWANVISPCFIFFGLLGFEVLADEMENPLGDQDVDLNIMDMIHDLEVRAHEVFSVAYENRGRLDAVFYRPVEEKATSGNGNVDPRELDLPDWPPLRSKFGSFSAQFSWESLPPQSIVYMLEKAQGGGSAMINRIEAFKRAAERNDSTLGCCGSASTGRNADGAYTAMSEILAGGDKPDLSTNLKKVLRELDAEMALFIPTRFLCLRHQLDAVREQNDIFLQEYLGYVHSHDEDDSSVDDAEAPRMESRATLAVKHNDKNDIKFVKKLSATLAKKCISIPLGWPSTNSTNVYQFPEAVHNLRDDFDI